MVWMVNEWSRWMWHNVTYITTAQWRRSSWGAGSFTLHSAILEPQCKNKNAPIYQPEQSWGCLWGCVGPSAAKVCTQCGIRGVRWSMSKQERVKFPQWEWISTTMLELISAWYLPASILNHIHLPRGTERSFQNVTVQAIKDRCWQIYMSKCQYFFSSCRGIRKVKTVTFWSVRLIFTLLS